MTFGWEIGFQLVINMFFKFLVLYNFQMLFSPTGDIASTPQWFSADDTNVRTYKLLDYSKDKFYTEVYRDILEKEQETGT